MKVNLDLAPACVTVFSEAPDQPSVVLLGRVKIGMAQGESVGVAPLIHGVRVFAAPSLEPLLLLTRRRERPRALRTDAWLEVISDGNQEVLIASVHFARDDLVPRPRWKPPEAMVYLVAQGQRDHLGLSAEDTERATQRSAYYRIAGAPSLRCRWTEQPPASIGVSGRALFAQESVAAAQAGRDAKPEAEPVEEDGPAAEPPFWKPIDIPEFG